MGEQTPEETSQDKKLNTSIATWLSILTVVLAAFILLTLTKWLRDKRRNHSSDVDSTSNLTCTISDTTSACSLGQLSSGQYNGGFSETVDLGIRDCKL